MPRASGASVQGTQFSEEMGNLRRGEGEGEGEGEGVGVGGDGRGYGGTGAGERGAGVPLPSSPADEGVATAGESKHFDEVLEHLLSVGRGVGFDVEDFTPERKVLGRAHTVKRIHCGLLLLALPDLLGLVP
jgi:hypothetical protein